jgi:hypothetical protein
MLAQLENLQSLNLAETEVTDNILKKLEGFPSLTNVYLWGSKVDRENARIFMAKNSPIIVTY